MFGILFKAKVNPKDREDFLNFFKWDIAVANESEPATVRFDVYQDPKDKDAFFVYEAYLSESGFEDHQRNEPFKRWKEEFEGRLLNFEELVRGDAICALPLDAERKPLPPLGT